MSPFPRPDYAALTRYAPDRRPVALDLSDNTNLWGTHPDALDRIRSASPDDLARYPELYADALRAAVAERFGVGADCVTTGAGSDDVLDSAFRAAAGPGATVSYAAPTFSMVEPLAIMNGLAARPVPWPEALDDPGALLEGSPSLVYVCRPNNPTGEQAPRSWVERLVEARDRMAARASRGRTDGEPAAGAEPPLVVLDEAYADFAGETLIPWAVEQRNVLVARTASKAYGLAGLRCGFAVGDERVALEVEKSRGPYKVAALAAAAVAAAIRDDAGWIPDTVRTCTENRERLSRALADRGLRPLPSRANFILFAAPGISARADARALREQGVALRPFSHIPGLGEGLRVTVGPWAKMETFLSALDRHLGVGGARETDA